MYAQNLLRGLLQYLLPDKNGFDYLIRIAKIEDHWKGNLPKSIEYMETAFAKIKTENNAELYNWTLSNLGDLYSHNNEYQKAYRAYLSVLQKDPSYYHCLKGIAWLAFSHDKNTAAAKKILNYLQKVHPVPDYELMLYKIAKFENNNTDANTHLNKYLTMVSDKRYGDMYNKYTYYLQSEDLNHPKIALKIAETEVKNRPTGESYNLLAWAYYKNGELKKASEISAKYLENKCFEPDALFHLGEIKFAMNDVKAAKKYLSKAQESTYELGPEYETRIKSALSKI